MGTQIKDIKLKGDFDLDWVLVSFCKQISPETRRKFERIFFHTWDQTTLGDAIRNAAYAGILFGIQHPEAVVIEYENGSHPFRNGLPIKMEVPHDPGRDHFR